jgi:hypothetical protein
MGGEPDYGRHRAAGFDPDQGPKRSIDLATLARALAAPTSIRGRLTRILLVSLALVLAVLGVLIAERVTTFRETVQTSRLVEATLSVQNLVHTLQKERGLTNGLLGGGVYYGPSVVAQRMQTDDALRKLTTLLGEEAYAGDTATKVHVALGKIGRLADLRSRVDRRQADPNEVFAFYTVASRALTDLQLGLDQTGDPQLRNGLQALYALSDLKDYTDWTRSLLNGVFTANTITSGQYMQLAQVRSDQQSALQIFNHFATPSQRDAVESVLRSPVATAAAASESVALSAVDGQLSRQVGAQGHWWNQMTLLINDLREAQQDPVSVDVIARVDQLRGSALNQLILFAVLAVLAIAVVVALVVGAARSIIGPLRILATEANTVATHRLPAAVAAIENASEDELHRTRVVPLEVPQRASSEIRLMARAVGRLQHTALSLASEQAMIRYNTTTSLANLGRRNQNLVRRQLGLISEFEREELDPAMLANMFELDHLATRMRRNAESLLVLVGESSPRSWVKPLPMVDVVRAALSEVEDYRRVDLKRIDDVYLSGAAATDLAHMLAELIENGLSFSPPEAEVEVFGRRMGSRYAIAVVDHGAGMQPDALSRANARLHDEENFLVAPTRFLGHYVVGRLAKRLGVDVRLVPAPITGITARLVLPESLLIETNDWPTGEVTTPSALLDSPTVKLAPTSMSPDSQDSLQQPEPVPAAPFQQTEFQQTEFQQTEFQQTEFQQTEFQQTEFQQTEFQQTEFQQTEFQQTEFQQTEAEPAAAPRQPEPARAAASPVPTPEPAPSAGSSPAPEPAQSPKPTPATRQQQPGAQRVRIDLGAERTSNGLVKRQARGSRPQPLKRPAPASRPAAVSAPRERTPNEVGAMLSSYRAAHQRGTRGDEGAQAERPPMGTGPGGPPTYNPMGPRPTAPRPPRPAPPSHRRAPTTIAPATPHDAQATHHDSDPTAAAAPDWASQPPAASQGGPE